MAKNNKQVNKEFIETSNLENPVTKPFDINSISIEEATESENYESKSVEELNEILKTKKLSFFEKRKIKKIIDKKS